jgi:hypothetical protein
MTSLPDDRERHDGARDHCSKRRAHGAIGRDRSKAPDQDHVERDVEHRENSAQVQRRARVTRRAERAADHEEHQHADAEQEQRAEVRQRLGLYRWTRVDEPQQRRREDVADRRENSDRQEQRREKRLVDRTVNLIGLVRAGEPGDQHTHPGKQRNDEDDNHEEDLPAHPDGGIAGVADEVADHRVVDDALHTADRVLQHRWPRELPHGAANWSLDNGAIEFLAGL